MEFSRYLKGLPSEQLTVLYQSPWTCLAVLRSLPSLPQQVALRLLFVDKPISDSLLRSFIKSQYAEKCSNSLQMLEELQVVQKVDGNSWQLEPTFRSAPSCVLQHDMSVFFPYTWTITWYDTIGMYSGSACNKE